MADNSKSEHLEFNREVKDATEATVRANQSWYDLLDFGDTSEWDNATQGLLAAPESLEIRNAAGNVVWSQKAYEFVEGAKAPDTANPSLWEDTRNNHAYGLFKVIDGIYQVRGYDMANLTLVEGKRGWIVFDTMMTIECSSAALALANEQLGERPVTGIIISHTHVDHYGGIKGLIDESQAAKASTPIEEQLASDKVPIIVPPEFTRHVVSENLYAGSAMGRRAAYQYGVYLGKGPRGSLAMGIGCGQSTGTTSFILPSFEIPCTGTELVIDGVRMVFQLTPGTEAPAEMNTWLPDLKALWVAENCTGTLHNLYTLRGAEVRDGNAWANYITEAVALWGEEVEVSFQSHNWPHWGNKVVNDYLVNTAAAYKFINDQTLSYIQRGFVSTEIAHRIKLPLNLQKNWYTRQYYGTVAHNSKAVYQKFMGWYDANPIHLDELAPEDYAKKLVSYLGDVDAVLDHARADFEAGEYQWVAQITNALVFADPTNEKARLLCADALEQLGYQAESGTWRNAYLTGALELRHGNVTAKIKSAQRSNDVRNNLTPDMLWDFLGISLDKEAMADDDIRINVTLSDLNKRYLLRIKNGPLLHFEDMQDENAQLSLTGPKAALLLLVSHDMDQLKKFVQVEGDEALLAKIMDCMDAPQGIGTFNIVEP
ncbi:MAG: alkyl sulfatase dimerization domain-containing protein [Coriobacteriales bacterium]|nr:alkyl sulfatase dimerization domain-containing protein [Coriobacteriales bacterium]